jgi:hypothetical protein
MRASFIDSWPTMAVKGKLWRSRETLTLVRLDIPRQEDWEEGVGVGLWWWELHAWFDALR